MPDTCPLLVAVLAVVGLAPKARPAPPPDLADYVAKPDAAFGWKFVRKVDTPSGTVYDLRLTSQSWHGTTWTHGLQLFLPAGAAPAATVLLYNQGGEPSPTSSLLGVLLARKVGGPVAFLYGVPNQPLLGGRKEDALIAETFVRYLDSGDPTWPLLLPMVKSVTAAMTAVQQFAAKEWPAHPVTHFVVTGASKRGWTSWLAAAAGDERVKAIAPMVIDTLNMRAQLPHQVAAFGAPSRMIHDYVDRGLVPVPDTDRAKRLWAVIDPWAYRDRLAVPKLIVNGTNDPYWAVDALNLYWADLPGDKHVVYVPNAGHNLAEVVDDKGHTSRDRAVNALAAFARSQLTGRPLPKLTWEHADAGGSAVVRFASDPPAATYRRWAAAAPTRDFRRAEWSAEPVAGGQAAVAEPAGGYKAFFVEAEYGSGDDRFTLCTQVRVVGPAAK